MTIRIRAFAVILAASTVFSGCSADLTCTGACGTLVVDVQGAPAAALPVAIMSVTGQAVSSLLFLPLAEIGSDLNSVGDSGFEPRLAQSWAFEDSVTIVFELDPQARWHDGVSVTASDVVFAYDLYTDPVVNAGNRTELQAITDVAARSAHTVAFTFSHPYPEQFYDAAHQLIVHPRHVLDTIPREALRGHAIVRNPVGNGPYRLARWDANSTIELVADTAFYLGRPGVARIILQVVPEPATILSQLLAEEADFTEFLGGPADVARIAADPNIRVIDFPSSAYMFMAFNFHDPGAPDRPHLLFGDRRVRQAIERALDREAIAQATMGDLGAVPFGPVSRSNALWHYDIPVVPFDTAEASRLLREAGWSERDAEGFLVRDGRRFSFDLSLPSSSNLRRQAAVIMQAQLVEVGIELEIDELEGTAWTDRSQRGQFDATFGGWLQSPKALGAMRGAWGTGGPQNWGGYSNPAFDSLLAETGRLTDPTENRSAWTAALKMIQEDTPAAWVIAPAQAAGVHARFENVSLRPDNWAATMWRWTVSRANMLPRDQVRLR